MKEFKTYLTETRNHILSIINWHNTRDAIYNLLYTYLAFIAAYTHRLIFDNSDTFMAVTIVVLADWLFGMLANIKEFKTSKALKVIWTLGAYFILTSMMLSIEKSNPAAFWVTETIITPILIFQAISVVKNLIKLKLIPAKLGEWILSSLNNKAKESTGHE